MSGQSLDEVLGLAPPLSSPDPVDLGREVEGEERHAQELLPPEAPPTEATASPREKLAAAVAEYADDLVAHALTEAKGESGLKGVKAVTSLLDAAEGVTAPLPTSVDEVEAMGYSQVLVAVAQLAPEQLTKRDRALLRAARS